MLISDWLQLTGLAWVAIKVDKHKRSPKQIPMKQKKQTSIEPKIIQAWKELYAMQAFVGALEESHPWIFRVLKTLD